MLNDEILIDQLASEAGQTVHGVIRNKIKALEIKKGILKELEKKVETTKEEIKRLEEEELPNLLDEMQVKEFAFNDGTHIKMQETVYTYVNKENHFAAYYELLRLGCPYIIKPVIKVEIDEQNSIEDYNNVLNKLSDAVQDVCTMDGNNFEYNQNTLSALARRLLEEQGVKLNPEIFKERIKRVVKIKVK